MIDISDQVYEIDGSELLPMTEVPADTVMSFSAVEDMPEPTAAPEPTATPKPAATPEPTPVPILVDEAFLDSLKDDLVDSGVFLSGMQDKYITIASEFSEEDIAMYWFLQGSGTGEELFLAQAVSPDAADRLLSGIQSRIDRLTKWNEDYYEADIVSRLQNSVCDKYGDFVYMVVADDPAAAREIVDTHIEDTKIG